jgi:hypothetical protein
MNNRIQELKSQCWDERPYGPPWFNSDKFAELIVKECAAAIRADSKRFPKDDLAWICAMDESATVVTKYFGVKE